MSFSEISNRLHAAIFANADADAPRLAFADHLAAVDPEHAELIRLQVQRFATDRTARRRWSQPSKRERELLARHGARWAQDVAPYARAVHHLPAYEFNRGFVERLRTDAGVFARLGEDLLRLGPIRHLALEADGTPLATVLAQPALRHLISLDLEAWKLGDEGAAAIAACPQLSRLVWLGLRHNGIDEPGVEALARAPWVRRLLLLDLQPGARGHARR